MATDTKEPKVTEIEQLFASATSDPTAIANVSKYVKTGRRWDLTHKDVLHKLMVIQRFKDINTRYGPACLVEVDIEGLQKTILFGSTVLQDQIHELGVNLPVLAVVIKPARAYTLSDPTPDLVAEYAKKYIK